MVTMTEFRFLSSDGIHDIYAREYIADGTIRGTVQISHGVAEHIRRYDAFARFLAENGYVVIGNDHLGHGYSVNDETELGFFDDENGWDRVVDDMHTLMSITADKYPDVPHFLFGHSMGSFLTRTYLIRYPLDCDGAVISGTGQQSSALVSSGKIMGKLECAIHGSCFKSPLLDKIAFGSYNNGFESIRTDKDWLSRDEKTVDEYIEDPLCGFVATAGLFRDMMTGLDFIGKSANIRRMRKDMPVYFISGSCDPVGENGKGVIRVYSAFLDAGMKDVSLKLYENGRHEMLNEINRSEVFSDVLSWLNSKTFA